MRGPDAPANGRRRASQTDMPAIRAGDQAGGRPDRPDRAGPDRAGPDRAGPDRAGPDGARPDRLRRSSLSNWSVSTRLVALFVMASVLGLVFGGLRIADAVGTASNYSRTVQLADVARQGTALAPNTAASPTTPLVAGIGAEFPASTRSKAATVLNQIRYLPSLRSAIFP